MRRINLLYFSIPFLIFGLYAIYTRVGKGADTFYGFAENQETQINLDHPVTVVKIHAIPGQYVQKGALLMEVTRSAFEFRINELRLNIAELQTRDRIRATEIEANLEKLRAERNQVVGEIQARIQLLESEQALNQLLLKDLQSIQTPDSSNVLKGLSPANTKLRALQEELQLAVAPIDKEIAKLEESLYLISLPTQTEIQRLQKEIAFNAKEQERLMIYAPSDGLVGYIHCQEGENISSFSPLISFYEKSPNTVVAYVHESLILQVQVGDTLKVVSSLHPEAYCTGRVSGLGHRVIEIPERLRKIPEIKTYGREVLIQIPSNNSFLQKEKVVLEWHNPTRLPFLSDLMHAADNVH